MKQQKEDYVKGDYCEVWLEDGILHCVYHPGLVMDLSAVKEIVRLRKQVANGRKLPGLTDVRGIKSADEDAKAYIANPENGQFFTAMAVIYATPIEKLIASFYREIDQPAMPSQFFTDKEAALVWLNRYRLHNLS